MMRRSTRTLRGALAIAAVGAVALSGSVVAAPVWAAAPTEGLVAEYLFDAASGTEVTNTATGSAFGSAAVRNGQDTDWTGTALTLRGGAKDGPGNWVELPDDLLGGAASATVSAEVQASEAILDSFHFLWNIGNENPGQEYFFASLNCGSGRNPLLGLKTGGVEQLVAAGSCGVTPDRWINVTSVVDGAAGEATLFIDGREVASGAVDATPAGVADQSLNTIARAPWPDPLFQGSIAAFRVYDRALTADEVVELSDGDAEINADDISASLEARLDALGLQDITTDTDVDLPTAGGAVTWSSSDESVITSDGTITPPLPAQPAVTAQLTATTTERGLSAQRTITVTVEASDETPQERVERLAARFVIPPVLISGTTLPTAPDGAALTGVTSSVPAVTVANGVISTTADAPTDAEIAVVITDSATGESVTRSFTVTVHPESSASRLLAYDRVPTSSDEANNADVALSMHLALDTGGAWSPYNENYGIFFAKTAETPGPSGTAERIIRSLTQPHLFHLADGGYGIVAKRTLRGGAADPASASSVLVARTDDLRSYEEIGMLDLGVSSGVNEPAAVWDSASDSYLLSWTSDGGIPQHTTVGDLADPATRGDIERGTVAIVGDAADGAGVEDYGTGNTVPVVNELVDDLTVRFGRIRNVGVEEFADRELARGARFDGSDLPDTAALSYDDGSTGDLAVVWDENDIAAVDTARPGTYEITGTLRQTVYATPFANERADPSVYKFDWNGATKYLMIATEDLNLNPVDPANGPHMPIRIADSIGDLSDEAIAAGRNSEIDLLTDGSVDADGGVMTGCFWAPEFHLIDGSLSILFMPCYDGANGAPDAFTGRASIIQLQKDPAGNDLDPADPANWSAPEKVLRSDGSALNDIQGISLDMTYFEDSGQSFYAWQMLGSVFIAEMDPADPTRITTEPSRIIVPEYAWDNVIAEGPNVFVRDGVINMIYSGSSVGDTYTTGLVTAPAGVGADLAAESTWTKLNHPIQKSGVFNGSWQLGTGHGMWTEDEDDNLLYVFHARTDTGGLTGRDMFIRRVHWASDGLPVFDLETEEELAPEFRQVSITLRVAGGATADSGGSRPGGLAATGASTGLALPVAVVMSLLGLGLLAAARRRRNPVD